MEEEEPELSPAAGLAWPPGAWGLRQVPKGTGWRVSRPSPSILPAELARGARDLLTGHKAVPGCQGIPLCQGAWLWRIPVQPPQAPRPVATLLSLPAPHPAPARRWGPNVFPAERSPTLPSPHALALRNWLQTLRSGACASASARHPASMALTPPEAPAGTWRGGVSGPTAAWPGPPGSCPPGSCGSLCPALPSAACGGGGAPMTHRGGGGTESWEHWSNLCWLNLPAQSGPAPLTPDQWGQARVGGGE